MIYIIRTGKSILRKTPYRFVKSVRKDGLQLYFVAASLGVRHFLCKKIPEIISEQSVQKWRKKK